MALARALAHTLAYDATIMGDYSLPTRLASSVTVPTLVIAGGTSWEWMRTTAKALAGRHPQREVAYHRGSGSRRGCGSPRAGACGLLQRLSRHSVAGRRSSKA